MNRNGAGAARADQRLALKLSTPSSDHSQPGPAQRSAMPARPSDGISQS
jgi:hypothetical protein